jgi:hypothetical protein
MMPNAVPYPGFIGGTYRAQSLRASQEQTFNFYPEILGTDSGKNKAILLPTPGFTSWCVLPKGPNRGTFVDQGRMFAVGGDTVYEISMAGTPTPLGTVAYVDAKPVRWASNGRAGGQILIAASRNGYILDLTTNVVTLVRTANTDAVGFLGGYFIALDAVNTRFEWSDLFDGTVWPGLNVYVRSNKSDPWVDLRVVGSRLVLYGELSTDYWWHPENSSLNPFQPLAGGEIDHGSAAPDSFAEVAGSAIWLEQTGQGRGSVVMSTGVSVNPISNHALQHAIENYARIDDAVGSTYHIEGHTFYLLTFPSARVTWVWDTAVPGVWTNRGTWISEENDYDYSHPTFHQYAFDLHTVADRESAIIYRMDDSLYLDVDERPLRRTRRAPALSQGGRRGYYGYFALEVESGVAPLGVDPLVELRYSDNGGMTFQSAGFRSAGKMGEFNHLCEWFGLGSSEDRVFEVVMSEPAPYRITNAYLSSRNA